jgi:hypothetical protein
MNYKEIGCKDVDCICLAAVRDDWWVGSCEHGNELSGAIKYREFVDWKSVSFWRGTLHHGVS